ncbi:MAG: nuclear transport factor 2 family protein [Anditalea sp.]
MPTSTSSKKLYQEIANLDHLAFEAYNTCNLSVFKTFFVKDLEFYHDKSGLILTRKKMLEILETTLCGNSEVKTRRELVADSLEVYPLQNFGAIEIGTHYYFQSKNGQTEKKVEVAKFTHIWKKKDNKWKISRVLSYDHQPIDQ